MTDLLLIANGEDRFSWGLNLHNEKAGTAREKYIEALKAADQKKFGPLIKFVKS